ncbi:MAG: amino acid permease [Acidobacteria bacterium]|nr:amino acid permease [Acidobacteriota bacterium]MBV9069636.1 amino acid permease [Acidobacteriota bacterium]MBV9184815.1 amino acid permease [Acidobacteriota bacterium]
MQDSEKLVRAVGFWGLVAMCINAVVGSGVFLLPTESYKLLGPFSLWAPLIFALPVFILVLCFAEAASHFSEPGGAYLYAKTAFGDFIGFETGWMNWLARVTSLAALSNGFVVSLARIFPTLGTASARIAVILISIGILTAIHYVGVKYGAASIYVFTLGKLIPLVGFIIVALIAWRHNPIPASMHLPGAGTDWSGAALFMLFAYAGFENMGVPAGEFRNPRKELPRALLVGTLAIAAIYVLAQLGAMSALPDLSKTATPIADAAAALIGPLGAIIVTLGALLSMAGTNSGTVLEGSRMLYAISLGRPRLRAVSYVHPTFRTPTVAILIHVVFAAVLACAGSFAKLAMLSAVARLTTYLFTCAAVPFLRKLNEGFRTPGLVIPILGTVISLVLFFTMNRFNFLAAGIAIIVGALIYVASRPGGHVAPS